MPRFHFNIHDGTDRPDAEGQDLPDWQAARVEAIRVAGEVIKGDAFRIALGEDWCLEVTDAAGLILFRLDFSVLEAPAVVGAQVAGKGGGGT